LKSQRFPRATKFNRWARRDKVFPALAASASAFNTSAVQTA
jgi:hypothetical protein